jgi:hypothetical protein
MLYQRLSTGYCYQIDGGGKKKRISRARYDEMTGGALTDYTSETKAEQGGGGKKKKTKAKAKASGTNAEALTEAPTLTPAPATTPLASAPAPVPTSAAAPAPEAPTLTPATTPLASAPAPVPTSAAPAPAPAPEADAAAEEAEAEATEAALAGPASAALTSAPAPAPEAEPEAATATATATEAATAPTTAPEAVTATALTSAGPASATATPAAATPEADAATEPEADAPAPAPATEPATEPEPEAEADASDANEPNEQLLNNNVGKYYSKKFNNQSVRYRSGNFVLKRSGNIAGDKTKLGPSLLLTQNKKPSSKYRKEFMAILADLLQNRIGSGAKIGTATLKTNVGNASVGNASVGNASVGNALVSNIDQEGGEYVSIGLDIKGFKNIVHDALQKYAPKRKMTMSNKEIIEETEAFFDKYLDSSHRYTTTNKVNEQNVKNSVEVLKLEHIDSGLFNSDVRNHEDATAPRSDSEEEEEKDDEP